MRAYAIALSILLIGAGLLSSAGAQAATGSGYPVPTTNAMSSDAIQLAGAFHSAPNKLGDKYMAGQAGGRYGIGGSEPKVKYFKNRMKKISRCCANSK